MPLSNRSTVAGVSAAVLAFVVATVFAGVAAARPGGSGLFWIAPILAAAVGFGAIGLTFSTRQRLRRLQLFAQDNGLELFESLRDPTHTGWLFHHGNDRHATHVLRRAGGDQPLEIGTYHYETGSGDDKSKHAFGYIRVPLAIPLPHVFADAKHSATSAASVGALPRGETIKLAHGTVTLHSPASYEQDAKALFQPEELLALTAGQPVFDAETIGTDLYFYMNTHVALTAQEWTRIAELLTRFEPAIERWKQWRDLRPAAMSPQEAASAPIPMPFAAPGGEGWYMPPGVAPQGQRMRRRNNAWVWVLAACVIVLMVGLQIIGTR